MPKSDSISSWKYFVREYPWQMTIMVLLLLLAGITESLGAISLLPLLSDLLGTTSEPSAILVRIQSVFQAMGIEPSLEMMLVVICGSMVLKGLLTLLAFQQAGYIEAGIATGLRLRLLDGLLNARWSFFTSQPTGELTHALTMECAQSGIALRVFAQSIALSLQVAAYLVVGAIVSWKVLVAGLIGGGVFFLVFRKLVSYVRLAGERVVASLNSMTALFNDALVGSKPLKVMGLEKRVMKFIKSQVMHTQKAVKQRVLGFGLMTSVQEPFMTVLMALGFYVASRKMQMDAPTLLAMAFFFQRIMSRFSSAQQHAQQFASLEGMLNSLWRKTEDLRRHGEGDGAGSLVTMKEQIEVEGLCVDFDNKRVLDGVGFTIPFGQITLLSGPSGSGKTTVADVVSKLIAPSKGDVRIDGESLSVIDTAHWRRQIGYVPQEVFLFNDTVRNNIVLDRGYSDEDVWRVLEKVGAADFVKKNDAGLDSVVGEHGRAFSGGQRQRLMIARALISSPTLLVLDESTSGLDARTEKAILETLTKLKEDMAILLISHQTGISDVADVVVELREQSVGGTQ